MEEDGVRNFYKAMMLRSVESERTKTTTKKAKLAVGGKVTLQKRVK